MDTEFRDPDAGDTCIYKQRHHSIAEIVLSFPLSLILNRHAGEGQQAVALFTGGHAVLNALRKNSACGWDRIMTRP